MVAFKDAHTNTHTPTHPHTHTHKHTQTTFISQSTLTQSKNGLSHSIPLFKASKNIILVKPGTIRLWRESNGEIERGKKTKRERKGEGEREREKERGKRRRNLLCAER